jgi:hypothetical protein
MTKDYERLTTVLTVYGIRALDVQGEDLVVEYDASRLHEAEVLAALRRAGIRLVPQKPVPAGGFDYTGEFQGLFKADRGAEPRKPRRTDQARQRPNRKNSAKFPTTRWPMASSLRLWSLASSRVTSTTYAGSFRLPR